MKKHRFVNMSQLFIQHACIVEEEHGQQGC